MALVYCGECKAKISEKAKICPFCGCPKETTLQLYVCDNRSIIRLIEEGDNPFGVSDYVPIGEEQQAAIFSLFGKAENLQRIAPNVYNVLQAIIGHTELVADLTPEIQRMLNSGEYQIQVKKTGELLAQIIDKNGKKIVKHINLKQKIFKTDLGPAVSDLQMQLTMMQVMENLKEIEAELHDVSTGLHDDRIAEFESCWMQYQQAQEIQDVRLRMDKLLQISAQATTAKCKLMKELSREKEYFDNKKDKHGIFDNKGGTKERESMNTIRMDLMAICQATRIEIGCYLSCGEKESAKLGAQQLLDYIKSEQLDNQDELLFLNSCDHNNDFMFPNVCEEIEEKLEQISKFKSNRLRGENKTIYLNRREEYGKSM